MYLQKYIKYKTKYNELKKSIKKGGVAIKELKILKDNLLDSLNKKIINFDKSGLKLNDSKNSIYEDLSVLLLDIDNIIKNNPRLSIIQIDYLIKFYEYCSNLYYEYIMKINNLLNDENNFYKTYIKAHIEIFEYKITKYQKLIIKLNNILSSYIEELIITEEEPEVIEHQNTLQKFLYDIDIEI